MGTTWSVQLYAEGQSGDAALETLIGTRLTEVVSQMSQWEPESDLSRFGRAPAGTWRILPEPFRCVLAEALRIAELSGGAFDPTLGPLCDLWGFGPSGARAAPPPAEAVAATLARGGWRRLQLDRDNRRLHQPGGLNLDLSGIAKGFAVDHVAEALEGAGISSYLVEIGGELRGRGAKADGSPWWVALEQPPGATFVPLVAALHNLSVATSGDYRRAFQHGAVRYAHTLDPRTGFPARDLSSVTVLHPCCMTADAMATAIVVLGMADGYAFAEREGVAAWLVRSSGRGWSEHLSPALQSMLL